MKTVPPGEYVTILTPKQDFARSNFTSANQSLKMNKCIMFKDIFILFSLFKWEEIRTGPYNKDSILYVLKKVICLFVWRSDCSSCMPNWEADHIWHSAYFVGKHSIYDGKSGSAWIRDCNQLLENPLSDSWGNIRADNIFVCVNRIPARRNTRFLFIHYCRYILWGIYRVAFDCSL